MRSLLRLIRMSAAHEITKSAEEQSAYSHKQHAMIDQMVGPAIRARVGGAVLILCCYSSCSGDDSV